MCKNASKNKIPGLLQVEPNPVKLSKLDQKQDLGHNTFPFYS